MDNPSVSVGVRHFGGTGDSPFTIASIERLGISQNLPTRVPGSRPALSQSQIVRVGTPRTVAASLGDNVCGWLMMLLSSQTPGARRQTSVKQGTGAWRLTSGASLILSSLSVPIRVLCVPASSPSSTVVRFVADRANWGSEGRLLAQACEHAALTAIQAEAARLAAGRASYRAIAEILSLPYQAARSATLKAETKLRRAHPHLVREQRRALRDLFDCLRNVTPRCHARNPLIYAPIPGGYDRRPVSLRPRAEGELPEDLLFEPLRFLRELPKLLEQCAVEYCG